MIKGVCTKSASPEDVMIIPKCNKNITMKIKYYHKQYDQIVKNVIIITK